MIDARIPHVNWMSSADESGEDMFHGSSSSPNQRGHRDGGDELTREDLLAFTGSAESGTSMEDTVHSAVSNRCAISVDFSSPVHMLMVCEWGMISRQRYALNEGGAQLIPVRVLNLWAATSPQPVLVLIRVYSCSMSHASAIVSSN